MSEFKRKTEFLEAVSFRDRLDRAVAEGSTVSTTQEAFLSNAAWEGYRAATRHAPAAMNDRERNVKKTYVDNLRSSVADLLLFTELLSGESMVLPAWLRGRDLARVLPPERIARLVDSLLRAAGETGIQAVESQSHAYADAILAKLKHAYTSRGERIEIVREPL